MLDAIIWMCPLKFMLKTSTQGGGVLGMWLGMRAESLQMGLVPLYKRLQRGLSLLWPCEDSRSLQPVTRPAPNYAGTLILHFSLKDIYSCYKSMVFCYSSLNRLKQLRRKIRNALKTNFVSDIIGFTFSLEKIKLIIPKSWFSLLTI